MEVVQIKKRKFLSEILRTSPIGVWHEIKNRDYRPASVRTTITSLRSKGMDFIVTEKGCIDYIKVQRIK